MRFGDWSSVVCSSVLFVDNFGLIGTTMPFKILLESPLHNPRMWMTLGWLAIVQSYRRSFLGPFWITLNLAIFASAMTLVYGALFGVPTKEYAAYVVTGMIAWFWVAALLPEVGSTFFN